MPDTWNYSIDGLVSIIKEKESFVSSALKELELFGLIKREYYYNSKGHKKANYLITDKLFFYTKKPTSENPTKENPTKENQVYYKYSNLINKELINKDIKKRNIKEKKEDLKNIYKGSLSTEIIPLFEEHLKIRRIKGIKQETNRTIKLLLNILKKHTEEEQKELIEKSIINSWKSYYENSLKNNNYNNSTETKYKKTRWKKPTITNHEKSNINSWLNDHKLE